MGSEGKHYLWLAIVAALAAAVPLFTDNDFYLRVLFLIGAGLMLFFFLQSRKPMTLEYIEGQKKPRFALTRYVDTEESRQRIAMMDAKAAEKK